MKYREKEEDLFLNILFYLYLLFTVAEEKEGNILLEETNTKNFKLVNRLVSLSFY